MTTIVRQTINPLSSDPWTDIADAVRVWCAARDLPLRDTQVLVPFAQHLALANAAWGLQGGWMPRIETTQTLARALRPPPMAQPLQLSFDVAIDRLSASQLLATTMGRSAWAHQDAPGHALMVAQVTSTAHALARAAFVLAPTERSAYWARARALMNAANAPNVPGQSERLLALLALEWAALAPAPPTDALFDHRASSWVLLEAGGADALARAVVSQAAARGVPVLLLQTDLSEGETLGGFSSTTLSLRHRVCDDFEAEAQCAAAQVLSHAQAGEVPVALVAQDRLLVRRVRALLARENLLLSDETGWTLSTTRAAALVVSALHLADTELGGDDLLDALKSCSRPLGQANGMLVDHALALLEATWRRKGWRDPKTVDPAGLPEAAAELWCRLQTLAIQVDATRPRSLTQWKQTLVQLLHGLGVLQALQTDEAGRQLWQQLIPTDGCLPVDTRSLDWRAFIRWLDDVLEHTSFVPVPSPLAQVVITPLARLPLRPFAAVVFPGSDELHLGAWPEGQPLLSAALADSLGLPTPQQQREAQWLAFCQVLRASRLTLLRRNTEHGETLEASPFVLALFSMTQGGQPVQSAPETRVVQTLKGTPVERPLPVAPDHLPTRLTASSCEALRQCPYRFFALHMLQLRVDDELDEEVAKRDYGIWLHEVLLRFHQQRASVGPATTEQEADRLQHIAQAVLAAQGLDSAEFLPYAATFRRFVPRYLQWLQRRDAAGALWLDGERALTAKPEAWKGMAMFGVIDRVDSEEGADGPVIQLIDYKTGSSAALRRKVKQPLEDTQLAFYAALMMEQSGAVGDLAAAYVALDDGDAVQTLVHPDVAHSAERLVHGIGHDLERLRQGAPMPALGEGAVCVSCEARGLCRRDEWSAVGEVDE